MARFGRLLHAIISPIALGIVFCCVVTPTGLILRLLCKDLLRLRVDRVRGEPIVCTPEDAFRCFMGTKIETMAAGNCFLVKSNRTRI